MTDSVDKKMCPSCSASLAGDADLCVHCGYDLRLRAKRADVVLEKSQPVDVPRRPPPGAVPQRRKAAKRRRKRESAATVSFHLFAGRWKYVLLGVPALVAVALAIFFLVTDPRKPERLFAALMLGGVAFVGCIALRFLWVLAYEIPRMLLRHKFEAEEAVAARGQGLAFLAGGAALLLIGPVVALVTFGAARGTQGFLRTRVVGPGVILSFLAAGTGAALVCQGLGLWWFRSRTLGVVLGIYLVLAFIIAVVSWYAFAS